MRHFIIGILLVLLSACSQAQIMEAKAFDPTILAKAIDLRENGRSAEAIALFEEAAGSKSFSLRDYSQFELGETYYFSGNYAAALPEYQKLLADFPKSLLLEKATLRIGKSYFNLVEYS